LTPKGHVYDMIIVLLVILLFHMPIFYFSSHVNPTKNHHHTISIKKILYNKIIILLGVKGLLPKWVLMIWDGNKVISLQIIILDVEIHKVRVNFT